MPKAAKKEICKFGKNCYRKNKEHLENYMHPTDDKKKKTKKDEESEKQLDMKENLKEQHDLEENVKKEELKQHKKLEKSKEETKEEIKEDTKPEEPKEESEKEETKEDTKPEEPKDEPEKEEIKEDTKPEEPKEESEKEKTKKEDLKDVENKSVAVEKIDISKETDIKELVLKHNEMAMPDDFYEFLEFCKSINPDDPKNALTDIGIELVGIYDLLLSGLNTDYKIHYRYFYDPPEFQTVLKGNDETMLHFGYFRDDPNQPPDFVGMNEAKKGCQIIPKGENLFSAINWYIEELLKDKKAKNSDLKILKEKLDNWCSKNKDLSLQLKTVKMKARDKLINCKTFHGAGMCVPVSNGWGYRDLPESYDALKKFFKGYSQKEEDKKFKSSENSIQEIVTLIQFANDESDYGMGLEFGLCMFSFGESALHKYVKMLLSLGYTLLGRNYYTDIIKAHLSQRDLRIPQ